MHGQVRTSIQQNETKQRQEHESVISWKKYANVG